MKPYPLITHPLTIRLRSLARRAGLVALIRPLLRTRNYEEAFSTALLSEIQRGDTVWDVGANVGYYTLQFAELVGPEGRVIAFEPSPRNFPRLEEACNGRTNIRLVMAALGRSEGQVAFHVSDDETGVTDRIESSAQGNRDAVSVNVTTGDAFLARTEAAAPDVLKLDVEGFEDDVLEGLCLTLGTKSIRALFVEVHFGGLAARGHDDGPTRICAMLSNAGYEVSWLDHSHLVARRLQPS
jgi:FkbM family methyltransferase